MKKQLFILTSEERVNEYSRARRPSRSQNIVFGYIAGIFMLIIPFAASAQGATTSTENTSLPIKVQVAPGLIPGDLFYFLDRWSEAFNTLVTFNEVKKVRVHLKYANERISEMEIVLKNPKAKLENIASARKNFEAQIVRATNIVKVKKEKGIDISDLAREIDDEIEESHHEIEEIFEKHRDNVSKAEFEIRMKITALSPDSRELKGLTQALESITKEKNKVIKERNDLEDDFSQKHETFEKIMGDEMSAKRKMAEALSIKAYLEGIPGQAFAGVIASSTKLLGQASEAQARGDFVSAKQFAREAKKLLNKAMEAEQESLSDIGDDSKGFLHAEDGDSDELHDIEEDIRKRELMMRGLDDSPSENDNKSDDRR